MDFKVGIVFEPGPGAEVYEAAKEASKRASDSTHPVWLRFNDRFLVVRDYKGVRSAEDILAQYWDRKVNA